MEPDLRSTLQRLASTPSREVDVASLVTEGRRRRRIRHLSYAALSLVVLITGAIAVPRLLDMTEKRRVAPAETPSPDSSPRLDRSPFENLPNGWSKFPLPPELRGGTAAIGWTGDKLIVWGGYVFTGFSDEVPQDDGFIFDARSRSWEMMSASPLESRTVPASGWTGSEFLIWGGSDDRGGFFRDGAAYDPNTDSWRVLPAAPIDARAPLSVWTGAELIVWGTAVRVDERPRDGAAYDPETDTWRQIPEAPIELTDATAAWTGREMIVFGAALHGGNKPESATAIAAAYDPSTDDWRPLPDSDLSPQASTAAWNGQELIAWDYLGQTAAFDPNTNEWRTLPRPLESSECQPRTVSVRGYIFGDLCGLMTVYDPTDDTWHDISRREFVAWGFTLVPADPVVLLMGRNADTGEEAMLAYRHPAWTSQEAPDAESDEVRTVVTRFMERRMQGRGAERLVAPDVRRRFAPGGTLEPMYFEPELKEFEIVFIDGPLGEPTYEVGVRLIFERGSYGQTYFVGLRNGRFLITGGRHGLEGP